MSTTGIDGLIEAPQIVHLLFTPSLPGYGRRVIVFDVYITFSVCDTFFVHSFSDYKCISEI